MVSSDERKTPRLTAPKGACDTHTHFYNAKFPSAATALMTPPDAWVGDYRSLQKRLNLDRVVIVQPTTYGTDNSCQLEAMKAFGANARGVMVADASTSDEELDRLTRLGVRGVRFHMLPGGTGTGQGCTRANAVGQQLASSGSEESTGRSRFAGLAARLGG